MSDTESTETQQPIPEEEGPAEEETDSITPLDEAVANAASELEAANAAAEEAAAKLAAAQAA